MCEDGAGAGAAFVATAADATSTWYWPWGEAAAGSARAADRGPSARARTATGTSGRGTCGLAVADTPAACHGRRSGATAPTRASCSGACYRGGGKWCGCPCLRRP